MNDNLSNLVPNPFESSPGRMSQRSSTLSSRLLPKLMKGYTHLEKVNIFIIISQSHSYYAILCYSI